MDLAPCVGCRRHVRIDAPRCPFCDRAIELAAMRVDLLGRISRAAVFSASLAGCWSSTQPQTNETNTNTTNTNVIVTNPPADAPLEERHFAQPIDAAPVAVNGVIEGVVRNQNTGAALSGVRVVVQELPSRKIVAMANTGAGGRYRITPLAPGQYQLVVQGPGDGHPRHGLPPPSVQAVTIVAGAPPVVADVDVVVPPPFVDHGPCCKPYGAPPVRRRVV